MSAIIQPESDVVRSPLIERVTESSHDEHDPHLAHHFESPRQQFEAAKFGMWLFLATEFLLFGGLFCLYAVFRGNQPEIFKYGSQFLDTKLGMINTVVLILSSLTMALAVYAAQTNRRVLLVSLLGLTLIGGGVFLGIKYVEYSHKIHNNLVWGVNFYREPHQAKTSLAASVTPPQATMMPAKGNLEKGRTLWSATCRTCHGAGGEGIPGQGKDLRGSEFIASKTDQELVEFVKIGRMPFDKLNTTGIQMPARGGNPMLKDQDLLDIVAYVRTFKKADEQAAAAQPGAATAAQPQELFIPKSSIPSANSGPAGLMAEWNVKPAATHTKVLDPRMDPNRPANVHLFFGLYFLMTGLHGVHVLIGMLIIAWLTIRAARGHFSSKYFTPVDLTGLYWHVVDVIWIFLFPMLYLIH